MPEFAVWLGEHDGVSFSEPLVSGASFGLGDAQRLGCLRHLGSSSVLDELLVGVAAEFGVE
jgi:hypothetical protein